MTTDSEPSDTLAGDILWGVPAIAAYIDRDERQTYHGLQQGYFPAQKVGRIWTSTKSALKRRLTPTAAGTSISIGA
jgi:hypothetical protein